MESEYLKSTVGDILTEVLKEVVEIRPLDPIAFIARQMIKWSENFERRRQMLEEAEETMRLMRELRGPSIVGDGEGDEGEDADGEPKPDEEEAENSA